jgi:hypothetical protein
MARTGGRVDAGRGTHDGRWQDVMKKRRFYLNRLPTAVLSLFFPPAFPAGTKIRCGAITREYNRRSVAECNSWWKRRSP